MLRHGGGPRVELIGPWTFEPTVVLVILALGALYATGYRAARPSARPRWWQAASFYAGLLVAAVALLSPTATLADDLFVMHMTEHTLLTNVAVPLVLLGIPLLPILSTLPRWTRRGAVRWLTSRTIVRALGRLANAPFVAFALYFVVTLGWHIPQAYAAATGSEPLHVVQHVSFVAAAGLFWSQVIDPFPFSAPLPLPVRLLYVFGAGFPHHVLTSTVLLFSDRPLYPMYLGRTSPYGVAPLIDQQYAGGVMAVGWFLASLTAVSVLFFAWLRQEEEQQRAREASEAAYGDDTRRRSTARGSDARQ